MGLDRHLNTTIAEYEPILDKDTMMKGIGAPFQSDMSGVLSASRGVPNQVVKCLRGCGFQGGHEP